MKIDIMPLLRYNILNSPDAEIYASIIMTFVVIPERSKK